MRTCTVTLESMPGSPLAQSRFVDEKKDAKETPMAYEERTWAKKLHVADDGHILLPAMGVKQSMVAACSHLGIKIPGRQNKTYNASFEGGIMIEGDPVTDRKATDAVPVRLFLNADGKRGSGKRVQRIIPHIKQWKSTFTVVIFDDIITEEVFERVLREAGRFKGIGQFRPEKGGTNGRFNVTSIKWHAA